MMFLPSIARGECFFSIGMSEPDSGSDLASVHALARKMDGGWKSLWIENMDESRVEESFHFGPLSNVPPHGESACRIKSTSCESERSWVDVRPIELMNGHQHFAEVNYDEIFVGSDMLLGHEGEGWSQVNAELAFEQKWARRVLSVFPLLEALVDEVSSDKSGQADDLLGSLIADAWTLRRMSQAVARQL